MTSETVTAGTLGNKIISCGDGDNDIITYDSNISIMLNGTSWIDTNSGNLTFAANFYDTTISPVNVQVNCTDGTDVNESSFQLTINTASAGACDLGCLQISNNCAVSSPDGCTLISPS